MREIFTILLLIIFTPIFAQTGKLYKGTINSTIKITLYLEGLDEGKYADQIIGSYKYDNKEEYFLLNGFRNNDGNIILIELATANFSGFFFGELIEFVATKKQLNDFHRSITEKGKEFRNY